MRLRLEELQGATFCVKIAVAVGPAVRVTGTVLVGSGVSVCVGPGVGVGWRLASSVLRQVELGLGLDVAVRVAKHVATHETLAPSARQSVVTTSARKFENEKESK
jgi:hypothetical protein